VTKTLHKHQSMALEKKLRRYLDQLYTTYNNPQYISTDPVMFLHMNDDAGEYELLGLIASSLAYGRVVHICKSIRTVLGCISLTPECLLETENRRFKKLFSHFKHRFTTGEEISSLFIACKKIYSRYGSLQNCFLSHYKETDTTYIPALTEFVVELRAFSPYKKFTLLPDPGKKSACKRLHLFLRWMIRKDTIDPGPWSGLPASKLIIPLDTHMHRIGQHLGFTRRKQADIKTAREITAAFRTINPDDPVKYDFALTRMGMAGEKVLLTQLQKQ
jgi:uncharacterized protein (TIGR02757 family)